MNRVPRNVRLTKSHTSKITCETYAVYTRCGNCGWRGEVGMPKGVPITLYAPLDHRFPCPHCGCTELRHVEKVSVRGRVDAGLDTLAEIRELLARSNVRVVRPVIGPDDTEVPPDHELGVIELKPMVKLDEEDMAAAIDVFTRSAMQSMAQQFADDENRQPSWLEGGE